MTTQSTTTSTSPAPVAGRSKTALLLLGSNALAAILVVALIVWLRANQGGPTVPVAPLVAAPAERQDLPAAVVERGGLAKLYEEQEAATRREREAGTVGAEPAPERTVRPIVFYLVETAEDAVALKALLEGHELALVAGTAEEQQQAYTHIELMQANVPNREVLVVDRRSH